uniref:Adenylate isopentenyltransferase n=1 Tax=Salix viminalis TaxID=40686 RepID=A0A6N2MZL3_SALVM
MTMRLSLSAYKQVQPRVSFQGELSMKPFFRRKDKVVFVLGPTGTGKSRLAIDLATHFPAEVVNCDKMQVYKGLDIVTNKVTEEECRGVPHHLLGIADPDADFTSEDFKHHASLVVESIVTRDRLPIIAGGSNSYVEALANDDPENQAGNWVPELDQFLRNEMTVDARTSRELRDKAIEKIKENTCMLAHRQLQKFKRLHSIWNWKMHRIDATPVFLASGKDADNIWDQIVAGPSTLIVNQFLCDENHVSPVAPSEPVNMVPISVPAMAAVGTR